MIPYVNTRLMLWSEWALRRDSGALGFPRQCAYTRLVQRSGGAGFAPDFDSDAYQTDNALLQIKKRDKDLFNITCLFYGVRIQKGKCKIYSGNAVSIAQEFGLSRDTIYARLDKSHRIILDFYLDN